MQHNIDFSRLHDIVFSISSPVDFDTVTNWMENRFTGLPLFHQSIHLKVKRYNKIIEGEKGRLRIPKALYHFTDSHLRPGLDTLLNYIQREEGTKTFGLLYLSVKLMPHLAKEELNRYRSHGISVPRQMDWLGSIIEVPIVLGAASRKTARSYESLAIGIRGMGNYGSALTLEHSQTEFVVRAGLKAHVSLKYMDHYLAKLLNATKCQALPKEFFNRYLKNHLAPELEQIVRKLCEYVFNSRQITENLTYSLRTAPLEIEKIILGH